MTRIETATDVLERFRPATEAAYRAVAKTRWHKHGIRPQPQVEPLAVHINCGRWVTPCACGDSIAATPGWAFAACLACGRCWDAVVFPPADALAAFDAVLSLRPAGLRSGMPLRYYSWTPGQTVADLERENARQGWPLPQAVP